MTKYQNSFARDLAAFLRGQGQAPVPSRYRLEWYFLLAIFLPAVAFVMWWGAIAWGINLIVIALIGVVARQESWHRGLRIAATYGLAFVFLTSLLVVNIIAFVHAFNNAAGRDFMSKVLPAPAPMANVEQPPPERGAQTVITVPASRPTPSVESAPKPTPAELDAKLARIPTFWQPAQSKPEELLLASAPGNTPAQDGSITLNARTARQLATPQKYVPPVSFRIIALSDGRDFRIAYAANQVIFNWEMNPDQLRVDGGPASGSHASGAGRIGADQWVAIEWVVLPDQMIIYVDGAERYRHQANFSRIDKPLTIRAHGGTLRVKSVTMVKPKSP